MATMGQGVAAVYGRAHDSVTDLYAVLTNGERVSWPIHDDPRNNERYFAVIADCQALNDIVAVARRRRVSLRPHFAIWFRPAPEPQPTAKRPTTRAEQSGVASPRLFRSPLHAVPVTMALGTALGRPVC